MTLVMWRMDVFGEVTLVICCDNCLQECELNYLMFQTRQEGGFIPHIVH